MPVTDPPLKAIESAGLRPPRAASAVRTVGRTETVMPMKPAAADATAPIRDPTAALQPTSDRAPAALLTARGGGGGAGPGPADRPNRPGGAPGDDRVRGGEVGRRPLRDGGGDSLHALVAGRLAEQVDGRAHAVGDRHEPTREREP